MTPELSAHLDRVEAKLVPLLETHRGLMHMPGVIDLAIRHGEYACALEEFLAIIDRAEVTLPPEETDTVDDLIAMMGIEGQIKDLREYLARERVLNAEPPQA